MGGNSRSGVVMKTSSPRSENNGSSRMEAWLNNSLKVKSRRLIRLPLTSDHSEKMIGGGSPP